MLNDKKKWWESEKCNDLFDVFTVKNDFHIVKKTSKRRPYQNNRYIDVSTCEQIQWILLEIQICNSEWEPELTRIIVDIL